MMVKNQDILGFKFDSDRMILKEVDFEGTNGDMIINIR